MFCKQSAKKYKNFYDEHVHPSKKKNVNNFICLIINGIGKSTHTLTWKAIKNFLVCILYEEGKNQCRKEKFHKNPIKRGRIFRDINHIFLPTRLLRTFSAALYSAWYFLNGKFIVFSKCAHVPHTHFAMFGMIWGGSREWKRCWHWSVSQLSPRK
jgi:hypothetical protein